VLTRVETMGKRKRSLTRTLFYAALPTILVFLIIEGLFRLYFLVQADALLKAEYEYQLHHPAYASKPWFSRAFVAAALLQPPDCYTPVGTHLRVPLDYKDPFFTIRDGIRATVGLDSEGLPSGRRPRKLLLLGGSTTFCAEVPDDLTYASQLQQRLAAIPETRDIEVVNCGITAAVSLQEVERLEYEIGRDNIPDFCVFLDGINDAIQGLVNGDPGGTMYGAYRNHTDTVLFRTLKRIARVSVAAQTIRRSVLSSQSRNDPTHSRSEAELRELAKETVDLYERNLLRAKEICDRHRIRMIVLLQPSLYSIDGRPWTAQERATAAKERKFHINACRICYPLLRQKLGLLTQQGILAYDISDAFDGNLEPIFFDGYHVESTGNRLIAEAILKRALPILKDSSSLEVMRPLELDRAAE
jgi:lysophospholipase L1-like esterase